jgi:hypothetical protein
MADIKTILADMERFQAQTHEMIQESEGIRESEWLGVLQYMKDDAEVLRLARNPALGVMYAGSESRAHLVWMAIHVNAWLHQWPGNQFVRFGRLVDYLGWIEVEIWVGHDGRHDAWRVRVDHHAGENIVRVKIFQGSNDKRPDYSRIGFLRENGQGHVGVETLPTGKEKGAKGGR